MRRPKRLLSFILSAFLTVALAMLLTGLIPSTALANNTGTAGIWHWRLLADNTLAITDCDSPFEDTEIPGTIDTGTNGVLKVTKIDNNAFAYKYPGTVTIPASVTEIGQNAFYGCDYLRTVTFAPGSALVSIGSGAFQSSALTEITLPDSVNFIGDSAFRSTGLTSFVIPADLAELNYDVFTFNSSLTSVTFASKPALTAGSVDSAYRYAVAFGYTGSRTLSFSASGLPGGLAIDAHTGVISGQPAAGTESGSPYNVTVQITDGTLTASRSYSLAIKAALPASSLSLLRSGIHAASAGMPYRDAPAFRYTGGGTLSFSSTGLPTGLTIDSQTGVISGTPTAGTASGTPYNVSIQVTDGIRTASQTYSLLVGAGPVPPELEITNTSLSVIGADAFYRSGLTSVAFPAGLKKIGSGAFYDCRSLNSVSFASQGTLTTIGNNAFAWTPISSVTFPASLKEIGSGAFYYCESLSSVTFAANGALTTIGSQAFMHTSISSITLPASLPRLGTQAFQDCPRLSQVTFAANGALTEIEADVFMNDPLLKSLAIPASVKYIKENAFRTIQLESVTFASDGELETIGNNAFGGTKLTSVTLPASLKNIGTGAFSYCASLRNVIFKADAVTIGDRAFEACPGLAALTFAGNTPPNVGFAALTSVSGYLAIFVPQGTENSYYWNFSGKIPAGGRFISYTGQEGTPGMLFPIATADELCAVGNALNGDMGYFNDKRFQLTADMDLGAVWTVGSGTATLTDGEAWTPVGDSETPFAGSFDGQGHTISGLYVYASSNFQGLFGYIGEGGEVKDLGIADAYIQGNAFEVGGIAGENAGTILRCFNRGQITGNRYVGGVVGRNAGVVSQCYNTGTVTGRVLEGNGIGGVVGYNNEEASLSDSYNVGAVSADIQLPGLGGVVGTNDGTVSNSYYCTQTVGTVFAPGAAVGSEHGTTTGTSGKTILQMQSLAATLGLFLPDTDSINNGYPVLPWQMGYNHFAGAGTTADPYLIGTAMQLRYLAMLLNEDYAGYGDKDYKLTADIDLGAIWDASGTLTGGMVWTPIGPDLAVKPFTGAFDGQGHTIGGMFISNASNDNQGLFGAISAGGTVKNVGVVSSYIKGKNGVGGLAGSVLGGTVSNSYTDCAVAGVDCVGGLVGWNLVGSLSNCYSTGSVSGTGTYVGGLVGQTGGTVSNSYYNTTTIGNVNAPGQAVGGSVPGTVTLVSGKTAAAFAGGEVAYLLQNAQSDHSTQVWGQTLSNGSPDPAPVLTGMPAKKVLQAQFKKGATVLYTLYINPSPATFNAPDAPTGMRWSAGGNKYVSGQSVTITADAVFTAETVPLSYAATVTVKKDGTAWSSGAPVITIGVDAGSALPNGSSFENGTYNIYAGGADTGTDIMVGDSPAVATLNYYTLTLTVGTGVSGVSGAGVYLSGASVNIDAVVANGYTWDRWSDNNTTKERTLTITSTLALTASAALTPPITYAVTYDGNGGTGTAPTESDKAAGATFTAAANSFMPLAGKQFKEWNTEPEGTGDGYSAGATVTMPAEDLSLYAIWEDVPAATLVSIEITIPPAKTVYTVGESLDISGMVVTGTYSDETTRTETVTLADVSGFDSSAPATGQILTVTAGGKTDTYAVTIQPVSTYAATVTVKKDGAAWSSGTPVITIGVNVGSALPNGSSFVNGTYNIYANGADTQADIMVADSPGAATLNYYTLTLTAGTGISGVSGAGVYLSGASANIDAVVINGYTWEKWSDNNTAKGRSLPITSTVSLTASATQNPPVTYAVAYDGNAGVGTAPTESDKTAGATFTAAAADSFTPPAGKRFKEWNSESDGDGDSYPAGGMVTMPAEDLTLYAIWEDIPAPAPAINPTSRNYDLNAPADMTTTITWNSAATVAEIVYGTYTLTADTPNADYTLIDNDLTIKYSYLSGLTLTAGDALDFDIAFNTGDMATFTVNVIDGYVPSSNADLSSLAVNGTPAGGFDSDDTEYDVALPYGTSRAIVTATARDSNAHVSITQAPSLPGSATVTVTAEDGTTKVYTISFTISPAPPHGSDATLSDLTVGGGTISGFDPEDTSYDVVLPYGTQPGGAAATVGATARDANASVRIMQATSLPGSATVEVTAVNMATYRIYTVNLAAAPAPPQTYTLTITADTGGSITAGSSGSYAAGTVINITASAFANYSFQRWTSIGGGTFGSVTSADTAFTMPAGAVTITAIFKYNNSGSDSGGGGSNTPTAPTYNADVSGDSPSDALPVNVDTDRKTASVTIPESIDGGLQGGDNITISMPSIPGVSGYTLGIPVPYLSTSGGGTLTFNTGAGSLALPVDMLAGIPGAEDKKAEITIASGEKTVLPDGVKEAIGDRPMISVHLTLDGEPARWNNPGAPVTIAIPYTPTDTERANPESIVIWYIDGSGSPVCVPDGHYDPATGTVTVNVIHFSDYAVAYNKVSFNDVAADAWYNKAVSFVAARGITTGTEGADFRPDEMLTRGEYMVMLMKAYGIAPDENPANNFADASNTYYTGYLAAAKRLGISAGIGSNRFAPDRRITRQELFTLLYNSLKVIGQLPQGSSGKTLSGFADSGDIAPWAIDAMKLLVETGTIGGNTGKLTPLSTTTRAEMAQVLYNLLGK